MTSINDEFDAQQKTRSAVLSGISGLLAVVAFSTHIDHKNNGEAYQAACDELTDNIRSSYVYQPEEAVQDFEKLGGYVKEVYAPDDHEKETLLRRDFRIDNRKITDVTSPPFFMTISGDCEFSVGEHVDDKPDSPEI